MPTCTHLDEGQEHVGPHDLVELVVLPTRHEPLRLELSGVGPLVVNSLQDSSNHNSLRSAHIGKLVLDSTVQMRNKITDVCAICKRTAL